MAATLLPTAVKPRPKEEARLSDSGGNGSGGGNFEGRGYDSRENPGADSERWATPLSAYRTIALFAIFSVSSVFATLTHVLVSRWTHSKDWVPISLPHILYVNTAVLLVSSLTLELARFSIGREASKRGVRWLSITLLLGLGFVAGQFVAWKELISRSLSVASNPGSFFFYFLTAAHAVHLFGGVLALSYVVLFAQRLSRKGRQKTAVGVVAFYWHFMDGLWVYLLVLLVTTIQH